MEEEGNAAQGKRRQGVGSRAAIMQTSIKSRRARDGAVVSGRTRAALAERKGGGGLLFVGGCLRGCCLGMRASSLGRGRLARRRRGGSRSRGSSSLGSLLLLVVVVDGGLDGVLGQHAAMELDRGQVEVLADVLVL